MKEKFTLAYLKKWNSWLRLMIAPALILLSLQTASSQSCPLGCNDNVQVSLDDICQVVITPDMILEDPGTNCNYTVTIEDQYGDPVSNPVTGAYIGETLTVGIHLNSNSCWGTVLIEDKLPPELICVEDLTIGCNNVSIGDDFQPNLNQLNFNPVITDNCDPFPQLVVTNISLNDMDCFEEFSFEWTIFYHAVDASGNMSDECETVVYFERRTLDDVVFPLDRNDVQAPALDCEETYPLDEYGNIDPSWSGAPSIDGEPIYPNDGYCEINVTYSDQILPICGGAYKILRLWTVLDWCQPTAAGVNPRFEYQVIKVLDKEGPSLDFVPDVTIGADLHDCNASYDVPNPNPIDNCGEATYDVTSSNGIVVPLFNGDFRLDNLPIGTTIVGYVATDECGNISTQNFTVTIEDDVPPVPVCDQFTVVTISNAGSARIYALTFDDGSYDNCTPVTFDTRRIGSNPCNLTFNYGGYVDFCCEDIGERKMVELRVMDENGNTNICSIEVQVQDKLDPTISCPPNVQISCESDYLDLELTGEATAFDNCNYELTFNDFVSIDQCNVGFVSRTWTAEDDFGRKKSCVQTFDIVNFSPFNGQFIFWPPDVNINDGCTNGGTEPENTGFPIYSEDACDLVAETYDDRVFEFVEDVCFKILRKWTVIDWCQFDPADPFTGGIWTRTQIIKVNDLVKPTFATSCDDRTETVFSGCVAQVELNSVAEDNCTPVDQIVTHYELDIDNDGIVNESATIENGDVTFTRDLAVGQHLITWYAEDACGNWSDPCTYIITVVDEKAPTPYCLGGINTVLMPSTGTVEIWAIDFDLGSFDNCPGPLEFNIRRVGSNALPTPGLELDCDDLGPLPVEIWVTDISGNSDFCETILNLQSNDPDVCPDVSGLVVSGLVVSEQGERVDEVMVMIENQIPDSQEYFMTEEDGQYQFSDLADYMNYEVSASRNINYLNGVSTLDIVLIQRHILDVETLDSPFKIIAADINNSSSISAIDLVQLRKLILGIYDEFPDNKSWKFIDAGSEIIDPLSPWPLDEIINLDQLADDNYDNDFVAVKIGDVNGTAQFANAQTTLVRNANPLVLQSEDVTFNSGDVLSIPVYGKFDKEVLGFQFTLNIDSEKLDYEGIEEGAIFINESNLGLVNVEEGTITVSWNDIEAQKVDNEEALFILKLRAKTDGQLSKVMNLNSSMTKAEAYTNSLETVNLTLEFRNGSEIINGFQLLQNQPNPFSESTTIGFVLPEADKVTLKVYDLTGKLIHTQSAGYERGINYMELKKKDLQVNGVLYYQLSTNKFSATKKMILLSN